MISCCLQRLNPHLFKVLSIESRVHIHAATPGEFFNLCNPLQKLPYNFCFPPHLNLMPNRSIQFPIQTNSSRQTQNINALNNSKWEKKHWQISDYILKINCSLEWIIIVFFQQLLNKSFKITEFAGHKKAFIASLPSLHFWD